ncbi:MAG: hypothetical protein ACREAY_04245 [Nitrososphaera sp.]|uniref:hypothetical protein n=1 Tax=Nitrososphaera sp. TaxID=1971748 RepID=UPI003D6F806F
MLKTERNVILALAAIAAVAFLATTPSAYAQTSQLTVNSQLSNGTVIEGYYTEVISNSDASQSSSYTPAAFTLNNGEEYRVGVADFLNFFFDYWLDTSSTERWRDVTVTADTQLTAIYRYSTLEITAISEEAGATGNGPSRLQLNAMAEKISVFGGSGGLPVPDLNLSGYKLQSGSQIMEYDSMYQLISSGLGLLDTMEAVHVAGIEWDGLTEAQQCYLLIVLNTDIQLDENGLPL